MWIRVRVTGGLVGPAGWEDHNIDLGKLPAETKAELTRLVEAAGLDKGPVPPLPPGKTIADGKTYIITVKGPKGDAEVTVGQGSLSPELQAVVNAVRKATSPK